MRKLFHNFGGGFPGVTILLRNFRKYWQFLPINKHVIWCLLEGGFFALCNFRQKKNCSIGVLIDYSVYYIKLF